MSARDYTLTLNGAAQCLRSVLGNTERGGPQDEAYRIIMLQPDKANTNDIFVGSSSAVSSSLYGIRMDAADTVTSLEMGHFDTGPIKLSDLWVIGTNNEKLHIFGIPF